MQSFSKAERLLRKSQIDVAIKKGAVGLSYPVRVHALKNGRGYSRFAISIPRRLGNAVIRNRWKRVMRESFRLNKEKIGPGFDIVAIPVVKTEPKLKTIAENIIKAVSNLKK